MNSAVDGQADGALEDIDKLLVGVAVGGGGGSGLHFQVADTHVLAVPPFRRSGGVGDASLSLVAEIRINGHDNLLGTVGLAGCGTGCILL